MTEWKQSRRPAPTVVIGIRPLTKADVGLNSGLSQVVFGAAREPEEAMAGSPAAIAQLHIQPLQQIRDLKAQGLLICSDARICRGWSRWAHRESPRIFRPRLDALSHPLDNGSQRFPSDSSLRRPEKFVGVAEVQPELLATSLAHDALALGVRQVEIHHVGEWWAVVVGTGEEPRRRRNQCEGGNRGTSKPPGSPKAETRSGRRPRLIVGKILRVVPTVFRRLRRGSEGHLSPEARTNHGAARAVSWLGFPLPRSPNTHQRP